MTGPRTKITPEMAYERMVKQREYMRVYQAKMRAMAKEHVAQLKAEHEAQAARKRAADHAARLEWEKLHPRVQQTREEIAAEGVTKLVANGMPLAEAIEAIRQAME
jgi:molecular chaperone GrpE (heat shock protein)